MTHLVKQRIGWFLVFVITVVTYTPVFWTMGSTESGQLPLSVWIWICGPIGLFIAIVLILLNEKLEQS